MKLNIKKNDTEDVLSLTVPDNATVDDLKIAIIISSNSAIVDKSKKFNLWYSGRKLDDFSKPLAYYNITPQSLANNQNMMIYLTHKDDAVVIQSTLDVSDSAILSDTEENHDNSNIIQHKKTKSRSKSRSKSKSKKCSFSNCTSTPLRMVGDCQFCQGKFCSKHRLLESHNCKGLKICKDKCYERNALKLQSEQTVASKV